MRTLAIPCVLLLAVGCGGVSDGAEDAVENPGQISESLRTPARKHVFPTVEGAAKGLASVGDNANGITYHGGRVMTGQVTLYYIWYGNWSAADTSQTILRDLASSIFSPWEYINTTYEDTTASASNQIVRGAETSDNSMGTSLSDADIQTLVVKAVNTGRLPLDPNGIYMVMTAPGVSQGNFGAASNGYCGWHTSGTSVGLKYGFVGSPMGLATPGNCIPPQNRTSSPNGNVGADAMASVLMHEISEALTDPYGDGWVNISADGKTYTENADLCAWTFGPLGTSANGAKTNIHLGSRDYLIQQNWLNAIGGFCGMSYPQHALYRYYNASTGDHFYTNKWSDLGTGGSGYVYEGVTGRFYGTNREIGMIPMYRSYNPNSRLHFYTSSQTEATNAGYQIEGIVGYMYATGRRSTLPVYRYFRPANGSHFYSTNTQELGQGGNGWTLEGVVGYVSPP